MIPPCIFCGPWKVRPGPPTASSSSFRFMPAPKECSLPPAWPPCPRVGPFGSRGSDLSDPALSPRGPAESFRSDLRKRVGDPRAAGVQCRPEFGNQYPPGHAGFLGGGNGGQCDPSFLDHSPYGYLRSIGEGYHGVLPDGLCSTYRYLDLMCKLFTSLDNSP